MRTISPVLQDDRIFELAEEFGTPLTIIDEQRVQDNVSSVLDAISGRIELRVAVKAFATPWLLSPLSQMRVGFDVASPNEIQLAECLGVRPQAMHFYMPGARTHDIARAMEAGCSVSIDRLDLVEFLVFLDGGPGVDIRVAANISLDEDMAWVDSACSAKLGVERQVVPDFIEALGKIGCWNVGLHYHLGSQICGIEPYCDQLRDALKLVSRFPQIARVNLGGGMSAGYPGERGFDFAELAREIDKIRSELTIDRHVDVTIEPGRALCHDAVIHVAQATDVRAVAGRVVVICDGRLSSLDLPLDVSSSRAGDGAAIDTEIYGMACSPHDLLAHAQMMPLQPGDYICFRGVGAYALQLEGVLQARSKAKEIAILSTGEIIVRRLPASLDDFLSITL